MPVIVLEAKDFTSPLFVVRTLEVILSCVTFSLVASLDSTDLSKNQLYLNSFWIFCMFTWCFFFTLTLLIHILSVIQFHSLIPISWKNLTMMVAVLGTLMCLSTSVVFPWIIMDQQILLPRPIAAAVTSCLTMLAYTSESFILRTQAHEQRGYMGSVPGLLKLLQLWGGCQMIPVVVKMDYCLTSGVQCWQQWVSCMSYGVCVFMSLVTLVVILGDFAGRCFLPFDKFLAVFSLIGVLLYMVATVFCFSKILKLKVNENADLIIMETVVASITLLAYTVDLTYSIKQLCDRSHA